MYVGLGPTYPFISNIKYVLANGEWTPSFTWKMCDGTYPNSLCHVHYIQKAYVWFTREEENV